MWAFPDKDENVKAIYEDYKKRTTLFFEGEKGDETLVKQVETFKRVGEIATITYDFKSGKQVTLYRSGKRVSKIIPQLESMDTDACLDRLGPRIPLRPDADVRSFLRPNR